MTEVIMPKMGDGMEEGTLLEWLKKDGDSVKAGEIIGTIQTDKATLELEAPGSGKLTGLLLKGGETVPVGKAIAAIVGSGESLPEGWGGNGAAPSASAPAKASAPENKEPASVESKEGSQTEESSAPTSNGAAVSAAESAPASGDRVKASPLAKKIAQEQGLDLTQITGTGPGGRIVEKDVRDFKPAAKAAAPSAPSKADRQVPLNRLRQITAKRTTESKQQVPHFYVTVEVDIEKILELRKMFEAEESGKVSINDFIVKASARALRDMPEVNAVFQGTALNIVGDVHIGIAAAIEEGLTVPVIRNADQISLREISTRTKDLVRKAKENKLSVDELSGSTFSITNMGMLDVDNFIAIINQPNSAILAVSSARKKVVATEEDEVEIRMRMKITCSFDHRVIDGAIGAKFINLVKNYLENPTRLLS